MTEINDAWTFRGTALHGTDWNIRILSPIEQVPGRSGSNVRVPGLDGSIYRLKSMDERVISLQMFVKGSSGSALQRNIETLKALFGRPGQGVLGRTVAGRTATWSINAEVASVVDLMPTGPLSYDMTVNFLCADPYWAGATYNVVQSSISSSPTSWTVVNNGTAIQERMSIFVGGAITNPKLTVGDYWVQYTGTVAAGGTLEIDCETFEARYSAANVVNLITHGGGLRWMRLMPGNNTMTLTGTGVSGAGVTVEFTELWL